MTKPQFDYWVSSTPLIPAFGGLLTHAAGVLIHRIDRGRDEKVDHDFGECYGRTKDEAEEKMRAKVREWIRQQEEQADKA